MIRLMNRFEKIYAIVSSIPKSKVITYKQVSDIIGIKNPRIVGFALHKNKNPKKIPCHRVVHSDGTLAKGYAFGGPLKQKEKLKKEGVSFLNDKKVDLKNSFYSILSKSIS